MYVAILCVSRNWSVSASESNESVWVRWGRGRVMYLYISLLAISPVFPKTGTREGNKVEKNERKRLTPWT
jgi:hypothetical protein